METAGTGADEIEFLVSANPASRPPLAKVASGGELSRISLAIQVAAVRGRGTCPCWCSMKWSRRRRCASRKSSVDNCATLGDRAQVLCVTHLPQVASQAHAHVRVMKLSRRTRPHARRCIHSTLRERVEEIARMLGGRRGHRRKPARTPLKCSGAQGGARKNAPNGQGLNESPLIRIAALSLARWAVRALAVPVQNHGVIHDLELQVFATTRCRSSMPSP